MHKENVEEITVQSYKVHAQSILSYLLTVVHLLDIEYPSIFLA